MFCVHEQATTVFDLVTLLRAKVDAAQRFTLLTGGDAHSRRSL